MTAPLKLDGKVFGALSVLRMVRVGGVRKWECQCSCGKAVAVLGRSLVSGKTKSCGHLRVGVQPTHGGSNDREYGIWHGMRQRCSNPKRAQYKHYGGRGIKVCARWLNNYEAFLADMGPSPFENAEIDRIDNDGDYCPSNCRWVSHTENVRNKSTTRRLQYGGETKTIIEWAAQLGVSPRLLKVRKGRGWTDAETITGVRSGHVKAARSDSLYLTFGGETLPLKEWSNRTGIPYKRMHQRLSRGASANAILERN